MFALGVATIAGSFFGAYPISASFGRSSVQFQSGVKTTLSNIYGGNLLSDMSQTLSVITFWLFSSRNFGVICLSFSYAFISVYSESRPCSCYHNIGYIYGRI